MNPTQQQKLSHLDSQGKAQMVDILSKEPSERLACAAGFISINEAALNQIMQENNPKGDVLAVARVAGIMAAKQCSSMIPLCHPLALQNITISFDLEGERGGIHIRAQCSCRGKTGVEMEALTAVSIAALTLYDMCKSLDKRMVIQDIRLVEKRGGKTDLLSDPVSSQP